MSSASILIRTFSIYILHSVFFCIFTVWLRDDMCRTVVCHNFFFSIPHWDLRTDLFVVKKRPTQTLNKYTWSIFFYQLSLHKFLEKSKYPLGISKHHQFCEYMHKCELFAPLGIFSSLLSIDKTKCLYFCGQSANLLTGFFVSRQTKCW